MDGFRTCFRIAAILVGLASTAAAGPGVAKPVKTERMSATAAAQTLERQLERALRHLPRPEGLSEPLACAQRLAAIARYTPLPNRSGPDMCGSSDLVRLAAVLTREGKAVTLEPAAEVRCAMAEAMAELVRDVAPAADAAGASISAVVAGTSYHCRSRNGVPGAKPSEHGRGNALDITAVRLTDGRTIGLTDRVAPKPFRTSVREAACERFSTVLGPGADAYHEDHVHFDLAERKSGYRICQWEVRDAVLADVPLPRPSPLRSRGAAPRARR